MEKKQDEQTTTIVLKYNRYTFMFMLIYVKSERETEREILSTTVKSGTKQNKTKNK